MFQSLHDISEEVSTAEASLSEEVSRPETSSLFRGCINIGNLVTWHIRGGVNKIGLTTWHDRWLVNSRNLITRHDRGQKPHYLNIFNSNISINKEMSTSPYQDTKRGTIIFRKWSCTMWDSQKKTRQLMHIWPVFRDHLWCKKKSPYKTGDLLKEVQFIWNFLWQDKKKMNF